MSAAFGEELAGPYLDEPSPVAELDRSLGLWEGDRVVATSGIYSRVLTVPGAVVPCAGSPGSPSRRPTDGAASSPRSCAVR